MMQVLSSAVLSSIFGIAAATILCPNKATAQDVIPISDGSNTAVLGTAYDGITEKLLPGSCMQGQEGTAGAPRSSFSLDQTMSEDQLAKELGFSVGGRARYGVVEGSAEANFLSKSTSGGFSIVLIYKANYFFPVKKLLSPTKSALGSEVDDNDERWKTACGDRFVHEIRKGANLYVSVRIDFASRSKKEEFSASFNISGPLASANGALKSASASFDRRTRVVVSSMQVGGDVSKLTAVLGGSTDGLQAYTQCTLGNFDSCAQFVSNALRYASDVNGGFPSQITPTSQPGPADLSYSTASYESVGVHRHMSPQAIQGLALARLDLSRMFEANFKAASTVRRLHDVPMADSRRLEVKKAGSIADDNISAILPVAQTCYEQPQGCRDAVMALRLTPIPEDSLLPATFLAYCRASIGLNYRPDGGPADQEAMSLSFIVGASQEKPNSGYYVTEQNCLDADAKLRRRTALEFSQSVNLWHLISFENLRDIKMDVAMGRLRDISALSMFPDLETVSITNKDIESLSPLEDSIRLVSVNFSGNEIADLRPLSNKPRLINIVMAKNNITDLSPLSGNTRLFSLDISSNPVVDLTPLHSLSNLQQIDMRNVGTTSNKVRALAAAVPDLRFAIGKLYGGTVRYGTAEEFIASWADDS